MNLDISYLFFKSISENKLLFAILTLMVLAFVFIDVFYIQRTFFSLIKNVPYTNTLLRSILTLCFFLLAKSILQTILDYYLSNFNSSLSRNLLSSVVSNVHDKYSENIGSLDEHLQTVYYDKMNSSLIDMFETMKYRKMQLLVLIIPSILYSFYLNPKYGIVYTISLLLCFSTVGLTLYKTQQYGIENETTRNIFLSEYTGFINNLIPIYTHNKLEKEQNSIFKNISSVQDTLRNNLYHASKYKYIMYTIIVVILLSTIYIQGKYFGDVISVTSRENTIIICFDLLEQFGYLSLYFLPFMDNISRYNALKHNISTDYKKTNKTIADNLEGNNFNITYKNVYSDPILKNVNLSIKFGEKVVIIGTIGSGKSTLIKTLCRLIPITSGKIYFDNVDIHSLDINTFRKYVGYVPQYVNLFNRTISENIFYGADNLTENERKQIIDNYKIMKIFPNLDKNVGFNGKNMSGGQRQLIYVLRNIINSKKKIIVMDEPTASLDGNTKTYFLDLIKNITGKTIIIVSHDADCISILNRQIIIDAGTIKNKLLKK
jgi:ABC-type multidrug transport system fused ATPase/permease subunit